MKISVIVVSYNMCAQLRRCLKALTIAGEYLDSEIIVVDRESTDLSVDTIMKEFPEVRLTISGDNSTFSKAVNHGVRLSTGEYVVFIQPDVIAQKDSLAKATDFMDIHVAAGGLGVRILDTEGNYLKESKKILPRTWIAFFKLIGLARQFPKSRLTEMFTYHHDDEFETTETDVLSNKFMVIRRSVLDTIGLFDERFTSYGNNIDLSYRIRLAGHKNYYYPKTFVIDRQTVQLAKFSPAHLKSFYGSMFIFAIKYFFSLPSLHIKSLQDIYPAYELKG